MRTGACADRVPACSPTLGTATPPFPGRCRFSRTRGDRKRANREAPRLRDRRASSCGGHRREAEATTAARGQPGRWRSSDAPRRGGGGDAGRRAGSHGGSGLRRRASLTASGGERGGGRRAGWGRAGRDAWEGAGRARGRGGASARSESWGDPSPDAESRCEVCALESPGWG